MKTKLTVISALLLFGWAIERTDTLARMENRWKAPEKTTAARQIKVLAETPEYRLILHPLGETKVPLAPRRIASLCSAATDGLVTLGIRPILVDGGSSIDGPPPYLLERLNDVPILRRVGTINLEAVLDAKPDLIFVSNTQDGKLFSQLSKIAPTVCVGSSAEGHRENRILDVGDVVGMPKPARQRLAEYRRHLSEAKRILSEKSKNQPVAFLRFRRNTCVIYTRTSLFGPLLFEQLGLTPDPAMPMSNTGGWDVLSVERLSQLQSEHIFMVIDPDSESYLQNVAQTPIWREIPAVKHNHVHCVAPKTWIGGDGVLGCEAIIKDVLAAIVPP